MPIYNSQYFRSSLPYVLPAHHTLQWTEGQGLEEPMSFLCSSAFKLGFFTPFQTLWELLNSPSKTLNILGIPSVLAWRTLSQCLGCFNLRTFFSLQPFNIFVFFIFSFMIFLRSLPFLQMYSDFSYKTAQIQQAFLDMKYHLSPSFSIARTVMERFPGCKQYSADFLRLSRNMRDLEVGPKCPNHSFCISHFYFHP